ncbi:TLD-domain-containing protein [Xylariomycetidae sp. FL0641]|nr:TLD-domain-containing protein [Xylariomycetidae sp. FL0641]
MSQTGNLIDLDDSPPASGISTPFSAISPPNSQSASAYLPPKPSPPPPAHPRPPNPTSSSSTYGLGSAVLGLWRRISTVDSLPGSAPTPPPGTAQLYHQNACPPAPFATGGDGVHAAYTPPPPPPPLRRAASPRGLPSLEPLQLSGYREDTDAEERLLARGVAEEIRTFLPERLKIMEDWRLVYSLAQNGSSLGTLYQLCEEYRGRRAGFVLVVRDGKDGIFGAYLTEAPHVASSYYGTGECFLWRASLHAPLPPPPSADTTDLNFRTTTIASPTQSSFPSSTLSPGRVDPGTNKLAVQSVRFQSFAYSGANDYCIFCEPKYLSVGGGQGGRYGLWLDDELGRGHSAGCDTFCNPPLSDEGEKFDVLGVELWVVGAS